MKRRRLKLRAESIRVLADMGAVVAGQAYLSYPTDEMGACNPCATMGCWTSANPC